MDKKIAVYICTGCGIGEALDVDQLSTLATSECSAAVCKNHASLCSPEGVQMIKDDIAGEGVNILIIGACSQRVMYDVFNFEGTILDRVNLREQIVWTHPAKDEDTQMMAEDYLRMSGARMKAMLPPEAFKPEQELSRDILVVGGGVTGMTAALEAAKAGYNAVLVEQADELGGFQKNVTQNVVFPFKEVQANEIGKLAASVKNHERIKVLTGSKVEKLAGGPCLFNATINRTARRASTRSAPWSWQPAGGPTTPRSSTPDLATALLPMWSPTFSSRNAPSPARLPGPPTAVR